VQHAALVQVSQAEEQVLREPRVLGGPERSGARADPTKELAAVHELLHEQGLRAARRPEGAKGRDDIIALKSAQHLDLLRNVGRVDVLARSQLLDRHLAIAPLARR